MIDKNQFCIFSTKKIINRPQEKTAGMIYRNISTKAEQDSHMNMRLKRKEKYII